MAFELGRHFVSGHTLDWRSRKGFRHGSTHLPHHRAGGSDARSNQKAGCAGPPGGSALDAVGWSAPELPNRSQRVERHLAGERSAGGVETAARRRLFGAGRRRRVLYTMYGKRGEEVVLAANAETGETLWEQVGAMTFQSDAAQDMGNGPYSTPLIVGDRLFTTGVAGRLQCLDKKIRQAALDAGALGRAPGLTPDVRLLVEPHRVPGHRHPPGRRTRQGPDGVPAGRRQSRVGQGTTSAASTLLRS